jgi:hypothetical protein
LSIALMSVDVDELKQAMCRNFMVSAMVPVGMMLLARLVEAWLVVGCFTSNLTRHRPVWRLRHPVRIVLALCWTVTFVLAKLTSQPLWQRSATNSSGLWNYLKTCAILFFGGRFGRHSSHWWVAWRIVPSGIFACMPFGVSFMFVTGLSTLR